MRILILTFTFSPNVDGVAEAARVMADGFADAGHEVFVGTAICAERKTSQPRSNVTVRQFAISGSASARSQFSGEVSEFQEFILKTKPDAIFCHCWDVWTTELALDVFARVSAKKVLVSHGYSAHAWNFHRRFPYGAAEWLGWLPQVCKLPFTMRRFDRVVFLSQRWDMGRYFDHLVAKATGYRGSRVIPNGTTPPAAPLAALGDFRENYEIGAGPLFVCVANYSGRKNQELGVRAFRCANIEDSTLVFIGTELGNYGRRVRELDLELSKDSSRCSVLFLENIPRETTLSALSACDVAVLFSKAETQPIVLLEAMARGKPFISTPTGCVSDFKGGVTASSVEELAQQMRELAGDPVRRSRLGEAGQEQAVAAYDQRKVTGQWLDLVEKLAP